MKKNWKVIEKCLSDAFSLLPAKIDDNVEGGSRREFKEFLSHNELELALDELEGLGTQNTTNKAFWTKLWNASRFMDLKQHYTRYCEILENWPRTKEERRIDAEIDTMVEILHKGTREEIESLRSPLNGATLKIEYSMEHSAINVSSEASSFSLRLDGVSEYPDWIDELNLTIKTKTQQVSGHNSGGCAPSA